MTLCCDFDSDQLHFRHAWARSVAHTGHKARNGIPLVSLARSFPFLSANRLQYWRTDTMQFDFGTFLFISFIYLFFVVVVVVVVV